MLSRPLEVGPDVLLYTRRVCFTYFVGRKVSTHFQSYRIVLFNIGDKTRVMTCLLEEHAFYKRCLQVPTAFTPAMFNIGPVLQEATFKDRLMYSRTMIYLLI